ncbi:uncharacterized protein PV09_07639 [Verruconis gallopava]|uniref:Transcription factor Cmr1 n=1 Tax=Verruconis gallopava TaxID=253628 RepID=A0A0D1XFA0_9PEZI|nr:uncharacterized protein PV09_07639 [Verruconis gallopava]KIW00886.1 hypothetical protein PV09_07639 [Verruconis gallopava]
MVFCTYCGQSFTRDEHLERHILTHTNVKPFKCVTCHMSFARRDLLQRHYTVHGRDQNNQEGVSPQTLVPKSAGRTPIACNNCAKTKTKCDKKFPCSRCAARNLKCTLRPTRRQTKSAQRIQTNPDGTTTIITPEVHPPTSSSAPKGSSPQLQAQNPAEQSTSRTSQSPKPQISHHASPASKTVGLPSFYDTSPQAVTTTASMPTLLSPLPTPDTIGSSGFVNTTPMSGFDQFMPSTSDSSETGASASPRYLMDWSQIAQFSQGQQYETLSRSDLIMGSSMNPAIGLGMDGIMGPNEATMLSMMPDFSQAMPQVNTPDATPPRLDGTMSELELSNGYHGSRQHSISTTEPGDIPQVVLAQDGWNCFRSGPTLHPSRCPRTARLHLEKLERTLKNQDLWISWRSTYEEEDSTSSSVKVEPIHEASRDKLLAITQTFLHKALDIHKDGSVSTPPGSNSPSATDTSFVLLPPVRVLQQFLRSYARSFDRFFPLTSRGTLDVNAPLLDPNVNDKAASLMTLLMIAHGAANMPELEARWLTGGLTEACRISLFDLIEKNIGMASNQTVLQSGLLFTTSAAWSGDKWQMDIAMGQRGMYFAMLRHSGILDPARMVTQPAPNGTTDALWTSWLQQESSSRLIYSWIMVDQDLSLFRDSSPLFNVTELAAPMPDTDRLWGAKSASEWCSVFDQVHQISGGFSSVGSGARPPSLRDIFRQFLDDEIASNGIELTALHLRLLLHPLQTLVSQFSQLLSVFSDTLGARQRTKAVTAASTRCRLEEVQALLKRWFDLCTRYLRSNPVCPMIQGALIIYHLISLNAVTNFPEIERLARKEGIDGTYQQLMWVHKRCIYDVEEAVFHAGQVLRLIRQMDIDVRPPWWPGAVYRVALVLWTDSLTHTESIASASGLFPVPGPSFAADALPPDHTLIVRYLSKREGVPMLTRRDRTQISLDNPYNILNHCIEVLDDGISNRFCDGIRNKLARLSRGG